MKRLDSISLQGAPSCLPALLRFSYLQCLDLLTTIAFLLHGTQEGNPLVRAAMAVNGNPLIGLASVKTVAICLGLYCWRRNKRRLLDRVNLFYAVIVLWNLVALIFTTARPV